MEYSYHENTDKATFRKHLSVFKFCWLGFCVLFVLVAMAFFAVGLYSYLTPDSTLFGEESNASLSFVLVSLGMVFGGIMMFLLGRSFFRRFQAQMDDATYGVTGDDNKQEYEWKS